MTDEILPMRTGVGIALLNSENKVGFSNDVMLEDRATALIRKTYEKDLVTSIKSLPNGLDSLYHFNNEFSADKLAELMTLKAALMIAANPRSSSKENHHC